MSPGTPNCPVFVLCPAFVPCSFIIHFKGSITNLGQIKAQATRRRISGGVWPPKCTKLFGGRAAGAKEGSGLQGSSSVVKVAQQFVLSLTPECTKTLLRAFAFSKIFRGYTPDPLGGGEGWDGEGKEGQGREGRGPGIVPVWANRIMVTLD
jgi:hypothetical protein